MKRPDISITTPNVTYLLEKKETTQRNIPSNINPMFFSVIPSQMLYIPMSIIAVINKTNIGIRIMYPAKSPASKEFAINILSIGQ